jgi:hypothetical protein
MATPLATLARPHQGQGQALGETPGRPAIGSWFSTRLPNASNEVRPERDVQDFASALSIGKTVQSVRVVFNIGFMMIGSDLIQSRDDLLIYSLSVARAISPAAESLASSSTAPTANIVTPGAEDHGLLRFGALTSGVRLDAGILRPEPARSFRWSRAASRGSLTHSKYPDAVGSKGPRVRTIFCSFPPSSRACGSTSCPAVCVGSTRVSAAMAYLLHHCARRHCADGMVNTDGGPSGSNPTYGVSRRWCCIGGNSCDEPDDGSARRHRGGMEDPVAHQPAGLPYTFRRHGTTSRVVEEQIEAGGRR